MQIHIKNLRLRTIIGIFPWEKKNKQDVIINIKMDIDGEQAALSDKIEDTLDYEVITKSVIHHVEGHSFKLIETLVNQLLAIIMKHDKVKHAHVEIDKPGALRFSDSVSVSNQKSKAD